MTDFKPGDVALVGLRAADSTRVALRGPNFWIDQVGTEWDDSDVVVLGRRLVVLDPESTVDVDRICKALVEQMHRAGDVASAANGVHPATVAAALREFASPAPVKPPEPTGLGAVIEDTDGAKWVLADPGGVDPWKRNPPVPSLPTWLAYADITAVTVLSEGVPS